MKKIFTILLMAFSLCIPVLVSAQETQPTEDTETVIPIYFFADEGGNTFGITPMSEDLLLWFYPLSEEEAQYLSITDANQTGLDTGASDFTYEAWIKLESLPGGSGLTYLIMGKGRTDPAGAMFYIDHLNRLTVNFNASLSSQTIGYSTPFGSDNIGQWIHVAGSADVSAATIALYVNGVSTSTTHSTQASTSQQDNSQSFSIGGEAYHYFDGKIDEARFWTDIRTAQEISDNYQTELTGTEANLGLMDKTVGYFGNFLPFNNSTITFIPLFRLSPR